MRAAETRPISGVSLLELLAAMAIVALLFSLAIPAWREQVRKARRIDATSLLLHAATRQEFFRLANHRYANSAELFLAPPAGLGLRTEHKSYSLSSQAGADDFLLTASIIAGGPQGDDEECRQMTIDETGRRAATDSNGTDTSSRCWPGG
ncbi:MAG: type IV pilin protein [Gammaproteobacteria bacterium]|jgi:type IV pilus assembly protein PilE